MHGTPCQSNEIGPLAGKPSRKITQYDVHMKRITVSLPDDLVARIKRSAGGEGHVSSYVAAALADYQEREGLDKVLAAWQRQTPISDDVRDHVRGELDQVGLVDSGKRRVQKAG
jgi:hypothetical protein